MPENEQKEVQQCRPQPNLKMTMMTKEVPMRVDHVIGTVAAIAAGPEKELHHSRYLYVDHGRAWATDHYVLAAVDITDHENEALTLNATDVKRALARARDGFAQLFINDGEAWVIVTENGKGALSTKVNIEQRDPPDYQHLLKQIKPSFSCSMDARKLRKLLDVVIALYEHDKHLPATVTFHFSSDTTEVALAAQHRNRRFDGLIMPLTLRDNGTRRGAHVPPYSQVAKEVEEE